MKDSIVDIIKSLPLREIEKGTQLFGIDTIVDTCYAIQNGYVKITSVDNDGREELHWIAGRFDIVPTEALFRRSHSLEYFYTALTDITVYEIQRPMLLELAQKYPQVSMEIARGMSEHFDDMLLRVKSTGRSSLREKIIYTLLFICQRFGDASPTLNLHTIGLPLTQQEIANMVGASRESTTLELLKLRKEKLVKYSRTSFIVECDKLTALINE